MIGDSHPATPEQSRHEAELQERWQVPSATAREIDRFMTFTNKLGRQAKPPYEDLVSEVYSTFMIRPPHESDPVTDELASDCQRRAEAAKNNLEITAQELRTSGNRLLNVEVAGERQSWLYVYLRGGVPKIGSVGRLYINIPIERMHDLFTDLTYGLTERALTTDLHSELKTLLRCTPNELQRLDKIILYLRDQDADDTLDVLDNLVERYPELTQPSYHLPFSWPMKTRHHSLSAVTFAQSPGGGSFGESRAAVLVRTLENLRGIRSSPASAWTEACNTMSIDRQYPAFEQVTGSGFPNLEKYLADQD